MTLDGSQVCDDAAPALLPDVPVGDLKPGEKVTPPFLLWDVLICGLENGLMFLLVVVLTYINVWAKK